MKIKEIIYKLENMADTNTIQKEVNIIENSTDKQEIKEAISKLQQINNTLYLKHGLDDVLLDFQVYLNTARHDHDITDPLEENSKGYVQ